MSQPTPGIHRLQQFKSLSSFPKFFQEHMSDYLTECTGVPIQFEYDATNPFAWRNQSSAAHVWVMVNGVFAFPAGTCHNTRLKELCNTFNHTRVMYFVGRHFSAHDLGSAIYGTALRSLRIELGIPITRHLVASILKSDNLCDVASYVGEDLFPSFQRLILRPLTGT